MAAIFSVVERGLKSFGTADVHRKRVQRTCNLGAKDVRKAVSRRAPVLPAARHVVHDASQVLTEATTNRVSTEDANTTHREMCFRKVPAD